MGSSIFETFAAPLEMEPTKTHFFPHTKSFPFSKLSQRNIYKESVLVDVDIHSNMLNLLKNLNKLIVSWKDG